jgi:hypothetical protein
VDKAATFLMDDLLPAAGKLAGTVGDILGPALHDAGVALGFIYDMGKNLAGFFESLPAPLQTAVGALGAMAALKGPLGSLFSTLKDVGETAVLRTMLLKDAVGSLSGAGSAAKAGLGGLVNFFGGPWALALAGAAVGIPLLISGFKQLFGITDAAAGAQRRFTDALKETGGVIDGTVRDAAKGLITDTDGMVDAFKRAGVSSQDAIDGLLGNADAQGRVNAALQQYITTSVSTEGRNNKHAQTAAGVRDAYADMIPALGAAREGADFFGASADHVTAATGGATTAVDTFQQGLKDTADAADAAKQQTGLFKSALDSLTGATVDITGAEAAFWGALDAAKTALEGTTGKVLDSAGRSPAHGGWPQDAGHPRGTRRRC